MDLNEFSVPEFVRHPVELEGSLETRNKCLNTLTSLLNSYFCGQKCLTEQWRPGGTSGQAIQILSGLRLHLGPCSVEFETLPGRRPIMWLCLATLVPSLHPARISLSVVLWPFDKLQHHCQSSLVGSPSLVPEGCKPRVVVIQLNYTSVCVSAFWKYFTAPQNSWLCFCCCTSIPHVEAYSFS